VDNIELLPGASSALYGSGGMNGTVFNQFKKSFQISRVKFPSETSY